MIPIATIRNAAKIIHPDIVKTPLFHSAALSNICGGHIFLKLENLQRTGSFKVRGATYKIKKHFQKIPQYGVVAASAGNHAQGVALAARQAGVKATVVMPEWASITKQEATRNYGGELVIEGQSIAQSVSKALQLSEQGRLFIHPFDDPDIIAGQGTIGLEISEELSDIDQIIVPIGGGGLIAGIVSAVRAISPKTKIIGVQAKECPSAVEALKQGKVFDVPATPTIADGISVKTIGILPYTVIQKYVDDIVLVDEEQIAAAILMLLERKKILVEGAGAVPLAAIFSGSVRITAETKTILIISGGNLDSPLLERIISKGLLKNGRIMRLWIRLEDRPGAMAKLLMNVAELQANVLHIYHTRNVRSLPMYTTRVELELETRGPEHVREVVSALEKAGYDLKVR